MNIDFPEGASPLSLSEIDGLLIPTISNRRELDRWEQDNILISLDWADRTEPGEILSVPFLKELHREMFGEVWSWAGSFRKSDKNVGVDWRTIPVELKKLLDDVKFWIDDDTFPPDEIGARFHHRLVQVHLFPNGNGRHARLAADLFMEKALEAPRFTWGGKSLSEKGECRSRYISALRKADTGDYSSLIGFVRS